MQSSTPLPTTPDDWARMSAMGRPRLRSHLRLHWDEVRREHLLVGPEVVVSLNRPAAAIIRLCDGQHTVVDIVHDLATRYTDVRFDDVVDFVYRLAAHHLAEAK